MSIIFAFLYAMIHITCVCGYLRKYSGRAEKREYSGRAEIQNLHIYEADCSKLGKTHINQNLSPRMRTIVTLQKLWQRKAYHQARHWEQRSSFLNGPVH
jgi:hypothetical protein